MKQNLLKLKGNIVKLAADRYREAEGKYREAILCYDKVIKIDSNNIHALNSKGDTLRLMREFREARQII